MSVCACVNNKLKLRSIIIILCNADDHVGPISHVFTGGEYTETVISNLQSFEEAVKSLSANGGGDYPEYSLRAMLDALNYSFDDQYDEEPFQPMSHGSEMIVLTDATSKEEELERTVIEKAKEQEVSINFIRSNDNREGFDSYSVYVNIARETNGVDYVDNSFAWSILQFHTKFMEKEEPERRKRSTIPGELTVTVSRLTYFLHVLTLSTSLNSGTAHVTTPEGTVEDVDIEKSVMIYLKPNPTPGMYTFRIGAEIDHVLIDKDTSLDASIFYLDSNFTESSLKPLQECK